jgi:hypothetical protein
MKQFTHAWLAFMAIKRLEDAGLAATDGECAQSLIEWFRRHKDGVIRGAWYPDSIIKDNANSHVLKFAPGGTTTKFKPLPAKYLSYKYGEDSPLRRQAFQVVDPKDNLPDRCESIAESVIDHLKIQESEDKGSAVSPTDNQVALLLFMLSHYIADAHMPLHCDGREFSGGNDIHGRMEKAWEDEMEGYYKIDRGNERFFYDPGGYPLRDSSHEREYQSSFLKKVGDELGSREFLISWGGENKNVWDFMVAVCQHSYLLAYCFFPQQYNPGNVTLENWQSLGTISFPDFSVAVLADAIDSIARVWFRVWRRYENWVRDKKGKKELGKQLKQP